MSIPSLRTLAQLGCIYSVGGNALLIDELFDLQEDVRVMEGAKWVESMEINIRDQESVWPVRRPTAAR